MRREVTEAAKTLGLFYSTWSPGDGCTRYRFSNNNKGYFGCDPLFTALGSKEALTWLEGYKCGRSSVQCDVEASATAISREGWRSILEMATHQ